DQEGIRRKRDQVWFGCGADCKPRGNAIPDHVIELQHAAHGTNDGQSNSPRNGTSDHRCSGIDGCRQGFGMRGSPEVGIRPSMTVLLSCLFMLLAFVALASFAVAAEDRHFVGSASCAECHQGEYRAWQDSHHGWALR